MIFIFPLVTRKYDMLSFHGKWIMQFKFEADFKLKYYAAKKGPHTGMEVYIHIIFYILRYKNYAGCMTISIK